MLATILVRFRHRMVKCYRFEIIAPDIVGIECSGRYLILQVQHTDYQGEKMNI